MKRLLLLAIASACLNAPAFAMEDSACMSTCESAGGTYSFCAPRCSFNPSPQAPSFDVDWACVNRCTQAGSAYAYCQSRCGR